MNLRQYIAQAGYQLVDEGYYRLISVWRDWYRGNVKSFHSYTIFSSGKRMRRKRASLNMAKQGTEFWADLLWNEECFVNLENEDADKVVNEILKDNDFWRQTNQLTEKACAKGTGAYVVFNEGEDIRIDYVDAEMIFPLTTQSGKSGSCAFAGMFADGKTQLLYLMIHEQQPDKSYRIYNRFFEVKNGNAEMLTEVPAPYGILPEYVTKFPRFALITPNIANNIADVPLGVSVYANCIDTLKSLDLAYDGIKTSMEIGRPRMGVTSNMLQVDKTSGEMRMAFDANDIAVYDMGGGESSEKVETKDLTTPYRAADFEVSLEKQLRVYAQCIGLGDAAFKWDGGAVLKTATEVISTNSATLRTLKKHQAGLRSAVTTVVRAILEMKGLQDTGITIAFDDSVIRDHAREESIAWQWVASERFPFWKYLMEYHNYDEAEAKQFDLTLLREDVPLPMEE